MISIIDKDSYEFHDPRGLVVSLAGDFLYVADRGSIPRSAPPAIKRVEIATRAVTILAGGFWRTLEPRDGLGTRAAFVKVSQIHQHRCRFTNCAPRLAEVGARFTNTGVDSQTAHRD
jgi:hypothetical protein